MSTEVQQERNIRLIVAYDGTEIHGYQRQENAFTVQEALEKALSIVCNEPITIYGISRTDAGVHAKFQVVTFFTRGTIPTENLMRALIAHLPPFIVVRKAEEVPIDWKPRWNNVGKKYIYRIHNELPDDPLTMRYHWHVKKPLSLGAMKEAAKALEGTHDFTSFQGMNSTPQDPVKTIYFIYIEALGPKIEIHVAGDGFLYHMVRNIGGFLVDAGLGRYEGRPLKEVVNDIFAAKNRNVIGKTAPAKGLCLERIYFTEDDLAEDIRKYKVI